MRILKKFKWKRRVRKIKEERRLPFVPGVRKKNERGGGGGTPRPSISKGKKENTAEELFDTLGRSIRLGGKMSIQGGRKRRTTL